MYKQIWFYDNDSNNAPNRSNESIRFIKIPEIGNNAELQSISWNYFQKEYNLIKKRYSGVSPYFKTLLKEEDKFNEIMNMEAYDPYSGIQEEHVSELLQNVNEGLVSAVVFDWDRTLTKIEGLYPPIEDADIDKYLKKLEKDGDPRFLGIVRLGVKGFVDYLFHNNIDVTAEDISKRSKMIGAMIKYLFENKIPIFILTNNKTVNNPKGKGLFKNIIDALGPEINFPIDNILYNYKRNKEKVIMEDIMKSIPEDMKPRRPIPKPRPQRTLKHKNHTGGFRKNKGKSKKSKRLPKNNKKSRRLSKNNNKRKTKKL